MRLLMVSGDRQVVVGEHGPFWAMLAEFSRYFERIDVLSPRPDQTASVHQVHGNVEFHPAPCGRMGTASWIRSRGSELIADHAHHLIVSHDYGLFYNGVGSASLSRMTGVPYVSEIHHVPGYPMAANWRESLDRLFARGYVSWARERALAFRVVNQFEMPQLLRRWRVPIEKILVLPSLYIDFDLFHPAPQPQKDSDYDQDLVFVGRLVHNKGITRILDALSQLERKGREASLLIVGKGPLAQKLHRRAERSGQAQRVRFVEWIDSQEELAEVYRRSRLCVCASTCEGGPRYTVEAMACGTPVVSTPVGVMGDLLGDGEAGRLVAFDTHSLAEGIERLLASDDLRLALGRRAIKKTREFEYARAIGVYANGLRRLVGEPELEL